MSKNGAKKMLVYLPFTGRTNADRQRNVRSIQGRECRSKDGGLVIGENLRTISNASLSIIQHYRLIVAYHQVVD